MICDPSTSICHEKTPKPWHGSEASGPINLESNMLKTLPVAWSSNLPKVYVYIYHLLSGDGNFHSTPIGLGLSKKKPPNHRSWAIYPENHTRVTQNNRVSILNLTSLPVMTWFSLVGIPSALEIVFSKTASLRCPTLTKCPIQSEKSDLGVGLGKVCGSQWMIYHMTRRT